ncbi:ABC-three component system protein [Pseudomonas lactis]|uniref:ABC-three component system protein n=1 Tax=Pseudomonas lactis TaxID=1615674 RepID=UPI001185E023|nr:ABC-three component system protein [Pseudomonas lactis]
MLKKLRLKRSDNYDCHVATYHMSTMVIAYIQGHEHELNLGSEQGLSQWDDLVVESNNGSLKYLQVKRQTTNFSDDGVLKATKTKGPNKGDPQDLSALDEAFKGLSTFYKDVDNHKKCTNSFSLVVPASNIDIKKGLELRVLSELCQECRKVGATPSGLQNRVDKGTQDVIGWLKSWCGFTSVEQILFVLGKITVEAVGDESLINERTNSILKQCFDEADSARAIIYNYLHSEATDIGVVCPKHIIPHVERFFRTDQKVWTFYKQLEGMPDWHVDGLVVKTSTDPLSYVDSLWANEINQSTLIVNNSIPFHLSPAKNDALVKSLFRLAIHLPRNSIARFADSAQGVEVARLAVNGTLGTGKQDVSKDQLGWKDNSQYHNLANGRILKDSLELEGEALRLHAKMYGRTWLKLAEAMQIKLRELNGSLQPAAQNLWGSWYSLLSVSILDRDEFLCDMLKLNAEKNNAISEMRVGLLTVELMAESILFLLVVAVALGGVNARWDVICQGLEAKLVGLKCWGGTSRDILVRELFYEDDDETVELIIGGEVKPILVLPHIKSSSSEFYSASLQDDKSSADLLISSKRPKLLVTKSRRLDGLIRAGDLNSIREELQKELSSKLASRARNIMKVGSGDMI